MIEDHNTPGRTTNVESSFEAECFRLSDSALESVAVTAP
jgi:hypothetical protein